MPSVVVPGSNEEAPSGTAFVQRIGWIAFAAVLAASCLWILHLPLFPTQDGPVHLYYARVAQALLSKQGGFESDFRVARAFPPYSLHAYTLMVLMRFFSPELAEELLVCGCVLSAGLGFWYFARQLGRSSIVVAVLAAPFFLHRFLFMGFYGYSFGIGVAFAAMGLWCRADRTELKRRIVFLGLSVLALFSHPVPYLLLIGFCWTELLAAWMLKGNRDSEWRASRGDAISLAAASALFLYIKMYSHSGTLWTPLTWADLPANLYRSFDTVRTTIVVPLRGTWYDLLTMTAFVAAGAMAFWAVWRMRRDGRLVHAHLALGWGIVLLIALPYIPGGINGSAGFADRLSVLIVLFVMAAASVAELKPAIAKAALIAGVIFLGCELLLLQQHVGGVARSLQVTSAPRGGMRGVEMLAWNETHQPPDLNFDPTFLSSARLVERGDGLLLDCPWLELQIMMLERIDPYKRPVPADGASAFKRAMVWNSCTTEAPRPLSAAPSNESWQITDYGCFKVATLNNHVSAVRSRTSTSTQ